MIAAIVAVASRRLLAPALVFLLPATTWADIFVVKDAGEVEGELLNPEQNPRTEYIVLTSSGARATFAKDQVEKIITKSESMKWYESVLPKMPGTAEGNWKMAELCAKRGLKELRISHLEAAIGLDSEHEHARRALGYQRIQGKWQLPEEYWTRLGYVRHNGAWRLPQEVEMEASRDAVEQAEKDWKRKVSQWRGWVTKGRDRAADGREQLLAIHDPLATPTLAKYLGSDNEPVQLKLIYIEVLARLEQGAAVMIDLAISDADADVRDRCLDALAKFSAQSASRSFVKKLKSNDNAVVNRAAIAIARMGDASATRALIDALITKHKIVQQQGPGGNISATFGSGGTGFGSGSSTKVHEERVENREVLAALAALNPQVNFGFDQAKWKRWLASFESPAQSDLRRDP